MDYILQQKDIDLTMDFKRKKKGGKIQLYALYKRLTLAPRTHRGCKYRCGER